MTRPATRLVGNRYELGDTLGYGGMADVFRGIDLRLDRQVAVKLLRADLARDPSFHDRFRREAQAAASLSHPLIVSVFDTGDDRPDGRDGVRVPYIVMEYVEGSTLRDVLVSEGPLPPRRALGITADVCTALDYSHRAGIVHRDVKPGNVMLTRQGEIKVMDFGIARAIAGASSTTMTQTAAVVGTAQYLSPEQARGEEVDARSDVYSTGCLLYELLTGVPPFRGDSPVAVAYQHVREDAIPPSEVIDGIPPAVDAVVLKAMAKNPANRYQSAEQMREDLLRAAEGKPVLAPPVTPGRLHAPAPVGVVPVERDAVVEDGRSGGRTAAYALLALAVLAVFLLAVLATRGLLGAQPRLVDTPNLLGFKQDQAQALLTARGLQVGNVTMRFSDAEVGTVIEQNPIPTVKSQPNGRVDLVLSKGLEIVPVPALTGLSQDDAVNALNANKLVLGQVTKQDGPFLAGQVLRSEPAEGAQVPAKTPVALVVASGQNVLPNVVGQPVDQATQTLRQAGFAVSREMRPVDPSIVPPGNVLNQTPTGGGLMPLGTTVNLVVAQEPPPPPPSPSPPPVASLSPTASSTPSAPPSASSSVSATASASPSGPRSPSASPSGSPRSG